LKPIARSRHRSAYQKRRIFEPYVRNHEVTFLRFVYRLNPGHTTTTRSRSAPHLLVYLTVSTSRRDNKPQSPLRSLLIVRISSAIFPFVPLPFNMSIDILPPNFGFLPETHPYAATLSSSASSSTSSVFSDAASQASSASTTSQHSQWESEEWSSRSVPGPTSVESASLAALHPISRVSTFPQYQSSACRETVQERLPSLRAEFAAPMEQRQHPRRSSTTINQRGPPQLVRQCERKVNFVDCLVG
jgi:hypothetical protein